MQDYLIDDVLKNLSKRGFVTKFVQSKKDAIDEVLKLIPENASVGFGGSVTMKQLGIQDSLIERGNKVYSFGYYQGDDLYQKGHSADWYMSSVNAMTVDGEMVNIDGRSNRIAGIASGSKNVIIITGINKITQDLHSAIDRVRNYTAHLNAVRLNRNTPCKHTGKCNYCNSPDCMCNNTLIMHHPSTGKTVYVILVNESLGY